MGSLFEKAKKAAEGLKGKAGGLAREHGGKIDQGIDRLAQEADKRTGGKHADKIRDASERAKDAVDGLAREDKSQKRTDPET
jgi:hypothetical protein